MADLDWEAEDVKFDEIPDEEEILDPDYRQPEEPIADVPGYDAIFGAPDFAEIIGKNRQAGKSRTYERKVQSVEKALVIGALKRNNFPDAAAILKHGPAFARAVGDAAVDNNRVAKMVDMITAPDNPTVVLALTSIALIGQLLRNHEPELEKIQNEVKVGWKRRREMRKSGTRLVQEREPLATSTFKLPFRKKPVIIKWRIRIPGVALFTRGVLGGSIAPNELAHQVFSDPDVIKALEKQGIITEVRHAE
jgi:hypothetical protein